MANFVILFQAAFLSLIVNSLAEYSTEYCKELGYNKPSLLCSTCEKFENYKLNEVKDTCKKCCVKDDGDVLASRRYTKAVLEVCSCKFPAYPQIKAFVQGNLPKKYKNLEIKYVRGLDPTIKLYDDNRLVDELDIHKWNTDSVDEFLTTHLLMN